MRHYEGMILLDPVKVGSKWEEYRNQVQALFERRGALITKIEKWAERKLAYEIKGHKRAIYLLLYFDMAPENIAAVRRDLQFSEFVLRHLILINEKAVTPSEPEAPAAEESAEQEASESSEQDTPEAGTEQSAQDSQTPATSGTTSPPAETAGQDESATSGNSTPAKEEASE